MTVPTDEEIFNHMLPDEPGCDKCHGDVKAVEYDDYTTYKCLVCDYEPTPPEEL